MRWSAAIVAIQRQARRTGRASAVQNCSRPKGFGGARGGEVRKVAGFCAEADAVFENNIAALKAVGAIKVVEIEMPLTEAMSPTS